MPYTEAQAKIEIQKLIDAFEEIRLEGRMNEYKEEQVKKDFILKMFEFLNWNVNSDEVIAEFNVTRKEVDYAFRINERIKFFLEAKSFKEGTDDSNYLKQAINYGYQQSITWVVLTDFKSLKLLNCEVKGQDLISNVVLRLDVKEYEERFREIWLLSKDSFKEDRIGKWAESLGKKSKRIPIDKQLLYNFTEWRSKLCKNIITYNSDKK